MALAFTGRFGTEDLIFGTGLRDLEIAVQDGQATLYAVTGLNGGISRWQLSGDGSLPQLAGQQLHGEASLRTGPFQLANAGGAVRLVQGQTSQGDLTYYELQDGGSLGGQQRDALAGADAGGFGAVALLELAGGTSAFYAVGAASGALQGWRLDAAGDVQGQTAAAGGSSAYRLDPAALLATVQTAGGPVLLAADAQGLHSCRADAATGALTRADDLGAAQGLSVSGITALESFEAGGKSWALIGAAGSSSLTLVQVAADGDLRFEAQLMDTAMTRFGGVAALEVVEAEGHLLVLAAGHDGGLSLFTLAPDAGLIHLQSLEHMPGLGLQNVTALEAAVAGGALQVFAASGTEGGISQFTLPLADLGEVRLAAANAARLDGSAGNDALDGGRGADVFVINPAAGAVTVRGFTPGEDRLDLSLFEGLYSAAELDTRGRSSGIEIEAGETWILLVQEGGGALALEDVFGPSLQFAFPERQGPGVTLPGGGFYGGRGSDRIAGTGGNDLLDGLAGGDRLAGGGGTDTLKGGSGDDLLQGGSGSDRLDGGSGNDILKGGSSNDLLKGGSGGDRLMGGGGADVLKGNGGSDLLKGGGSDDRLIGGGGDDMLKGGGSGDLLKSGGGADRLAGGGGDDSLQGGGGRDLLKGGSGDDRLAGGGGNDKLAGQGGADVFVFAGGHGRDTVADFVPGTDLIDLGGAAADGFDGLNISRADGGTLIGTGSGRIFLEDLRPGQLDADDFLF